MKQPAAIPCILRIGETHATILVLPSDSLDLGDTGAVGFSVAYDDLADDPKDVLQAIVDEALKMQKLLDHSEGETH